MNANDYLERILQKQTFGDDAPELEELRKQRRGSRTFCAAISRSPPPQSDGEGPWRRRR